MTPVIGHDAILRELRQLASSEAPPHALMLAGPESIGREVLARDFAATLNCEANPGERPCGACRACRLIAEAAHPDVVTVHPGDTFCAGDGHQPHPDDPEIRICQVRGLIDAVSRYPFEARMRVIIIEPADRFRNEAANTFLKTLEEPPGHTAFVLITAAADGETLLDTIRSRCRRIDVGLVPRRVIEQALAERGFDADIAGRAAEAARGRPGRALTFAARPGLMGDVDRLLARCAEIASEAAAGRFAYSEDLANRWRNDRASVSRELDIWETFWERRLSDADDDANARGALEALRAITVVRDDLDARVIPRNALDLMLLRFPAVTLATAREEEEAAYG